MRKRSAVTDASKRKLMEFLEEPFEKETVGQKVKTLLNPQRQNIVTHIGEALGVEFNSVLMERLNP